MSIPSGFTEEEWRKIAGRRRDHLRKSLAASRNAIGARNEVSRLGARVTALAREQNGTMAGDTSLLQEQAILREEYDKARRNLQGADTEVRALEEIARQIEGDLTCQVGSVGLLLPDFSS